LFKYTSANSVIAGLTECDRAVV